MPATFKKDEEGGTVLAQVTGYNVLTAFIIRAAAGHPGP